jgi:glycosyltransferase involved in cell wall biosynthesis
MSELDGEKSPPAPRLAGQKRICFVATLFVTLDKFLQAQSEHLMANGWDVTWVASDDSRPSGMMPNGVSFIALPFKRGVDYFGVPRAILHLYALFKRERFDIVQYSTPNAAFYTSTAAWLVGIRIRIYAQWGIRYVGFQGPVRHLFKVLEHWCCSRSTIVEPDSFSNLEFSIQEGLYSREKGRVIWNGSACGVDLARFDIEQKPRWREEYRRRGNLEPHHQVIGFVGSVRKDKGCNELIAACRSLFIEMPAARLLLIGGREFFDTIHPDLRDWSSTSPQVLNIPQSDEIPQWMSTMDVFSLPSYREGFGSVVIEAEAMGVPVVVSDVPGPIDAMRHEETGLIVPVKNVRALASALKALLTDAERRARFGRNAFVYARDCFEQREHCRRVLADKEGLL